MEKQQDDHVLARLMFCRFTTGRSSIRCLMWVHVQGNCWKFGAWSVASPPPLVEEEKIVGTWMWMAASVASHSLASYSTSAAKRQWGAIPKADGNI